MSVNCQPNRLNHANSLHFTLSVKAQVPLKRATMLSTGVPQSSRARVNPGAGVVVWAAAGRAVEAAAQVRAMARESLNLPGTIGPMQGTRWLVRP